MHSGIAKAVSADDRVAVRIGVIVIVVVRHEVERRAVGHHHHDVALGLRPVTSLARHALCPLTAFELAGGFRRVRHCWRDREHEGDEDELQSPHLSFLIGKETDAGYQSHDARTMPGALGNDDLVYLALHT